MTFHLLFENAQRWADLRREHISKNQGTSIEGCVVREGEQAVIWETQSPGQSVGGEMSDQHWEAGFYRRYRTLSKPRGE